MDLLSQDLIGVAVLLICSGAVVGVLAGVFGVGGGAVMVPVLFEVFGAMGVAPEARMPLAIGTSLAIIIPTSIKSFRGHLARGSVDRGLLRSWSVPLVLGVAVGAAIARVAPAALFQSIFVLVAGINAVKLISGTRSWNLATELPRGLGLRLYGALIGLISSLIGIGGGQVANIIMTLHGRTILQAIATSAGIGVLISIPGAAGYMLAGLGRPDLPPDAIGYVSLFGLFLFAPTTVLTAGVGVAIAHSVPRRTLEIAFGVFLALVAARFTWAIVSG